MNVGKERPSKQLRLSDGFLERGFEDVETNHGGDSNEQPYPGGNERLGDGVHHRIRGLTAACAKVCKGTDDAEHGSEQTDEWAEGRRYLGLEILTRSRLTIVPTTDTDIDQEDLPALTA